MKKNTLIIVFLAAFTLIVSTSITSCKAKEGCGLKEKYAPPVDRDGNLSTKRGKSNLFSKKQRKKMKKRTGN